MRLGAVALAIGAMFLCGFGQAQTPSPLGALQLLARDSLRSMAAPRPGSSDFVLLQEPKLLLPAADGTYSFAEFDRIPAAETAVLVPGKAELLSELRRLAKTIEISTPELPKEQRAELERAQALLYEDVKDREPTELYQRYLDFDKRARDVGAQLAKATNPAERTNLHLQLRTIEQDWSTYGQRTEIRKALQILERDAQDTESLLQSWREVLKTGPAGAYDRLWPAIASTSGWTAVTITVPVNGPRILLSTQRRGSPPATQALSGVSQMSLRALIWPIPRPALRHRFLKSPYWRSTESLVISDGLPATSQSEVLPRAVQSLILIKGVELTFNGESAWQTVAQAIAANDSVVLGGLPLKTAGTGTAFTSPGYVASATPFVLGVVVTNLEKMPNPNATDEWPW